mgnify:CR=1 FL=1
MAVPIRDPQKFLPRVLGIVASDNLASIRVQERCGKIAEMLFDKIGAATSMEALAGRFQNESWWPWFRETETLGDLEPKIRVVDSSIRHEGSLEMGYDPWAFIVDGDLELTGDLICETPGGRTSTLIITGSLRARNLFYANSARIGVEGSATFEEFVLGTWGDGGATFGAEGALSARAVLLDAQTSISARRFNCLLMGGQGWREFTPDFVDGDTDIFVPEVLDPGGLYLDFDLARQWIKEGREIFDPEQEAEWRAKCLPRS